MQRQADRNAQKNESRLFWLGAVSALIYGVAFLKPYYLGAYFDTPLLDLAKISGSSIAAALLFIGAFTFLFLLYYSAIKLSQNETGQNAIFIILANAALFSILLAFTYPIGAADIFGYISHGRLQGTYGLNPLVFAPSAVPSDIFFRYNAWTDEPSTYGPVWVAICTLLAIVGQDNLWLDLLLFKGTVILFFLGSAFLIYLILARIAPTYARAGTILFAWNPLVLFETAANGHNDVVMVFFLLLALLLVTYNLIVLGTIVLTISALVKFVTAPILVLLLIYQVNRAASIRHKILTFVKWLLPISITSIIIYAPFWQGPNSIGFLKRTDLYTSSFAAVGKLSLTPALGEGLAKTVAGGITTGLFALIFLTLLFGTGKSFRGLISAAYESIFFYLVFAALWFQPWYLIWLVALGAIVDDERIRRRTVLFSLCGTQSYLVWQFILIWNWSRMDWLTVNLLAVLIIFGIPVGYTMYDLFRGGKIIRPPVRE